MIIVLDCDDVLANAREPFAEVVSQQKRRFVHWTEWNRWDAMVDDHGISFYDITPKILTNKVLENLEPEENAAATTQLMRKQGYEIIVVTARDFHPDAESMTEEWLLKHDFEFDEVIIADSTQTKAGIIKDLGEVHLYVDDNANNVISTAEECSNVAFPILLTMPWNKGYDYDLRVDKLSDVVEYI